MPVIQPPAPGSGGGGTPEQGSMYAGIDSRYWFEQEFGADEGYDEEFDGVNVVDDTFPTDWSDLSMEAAAVYRQSFGAGRVDWGGGGDTTNIQAVGRTLPATTTFDAFCHLWALNDVSTGSATYNSVMVLYRSTNGDFIHVGIHQASGGAVPQFFVVHYSDNDTSSTTLATGPTMRPGITPHHFFRITKQADNNYDFYGNVDGGCWFTIGANIDVNTTLGGDPTHIGFGLNTSGAGHVGCEWMRIRDLT